MTIDELIEYAEIRVKHFNELPVKVAEEYLNSIALATLKTHKQGLRMCKYTPLFEDYEPVQTELDEILNNLGE